jgi:2-polyprenyl-3-methyl-5-hydroxy-6-metoxy-1,4-benzoquinol methylase
MRWLESSPRRYDAGVCLLSLGHMAELVQGHDILDLGCGTGNMSVRLARGGAKVVGVDLSPEMLAVAREKVPPGPVRWLQTGAAELTDHFPERSFDTIVSVLLFSELSDAEQRLVLHECHSLLRPAGQLILADEVRAPSWLGRVLHNLLRVPLFLFTYLLTQTSTRPVAGLAEKLNQAGFRIMLHESNWLGDFSLVQAAKREE